ncbi:MAG: ribonuclease P protein component [Chitinophagales bacterium]|nr:ribonuclease P protein component [Chitinophagales bacterium]
MNLSAIDKSSVRYTFTKSERLSSKKILESLMQRGKAFQQFPFRFIYLAAELPSDFPVQVCMAVPKRKIAKSVRRNLIKRRMREAYRLQKHSIYGILHGKGTQYAIMVIYTADTVLDYPTISTGMAAGIEKLNTLV